MKSNFKMVSLTPGFIIRREIEKILSAVCVDELVSKDSLHLCSSVFDVDGKYVCNFDIKINVN